MQVEWLKQIVAKAGDNKIILFSHHQLYSHFEKQGSKLWSHPEFSAILRSVIVLHATPPSMRGRVTGIEFAQVASAPSLGNVEAGAVASLTSIRFSVVSGGILSVVSTIALAALVPALRRYDSKEPQA